MRPSRTRGERQQPQQPYLNDQELKQELHKQAEMKRNEKRLQQLREKEELLQHYAQYNLANQPDEAEFAQFLAAKKDSLNTEIQETFERHPQLQDVHRQMSAAESKKEQERLQRLKLREEERLRRANGLASAYEGSKEPLPFQLERQLKENINNNNNTPMNGRQKVKEDLFTPYEPPQPAPNYQQQYVNYNEPPPPIYHQQQYANYNEPDEPQQVVNNLPPRRPSAQSQRPQPSTPMTTKQEQNQAERERQRLYKEELDMQINQKRNAEVQQNFKPYSQQQQQRGNQQPAEDFFQKFGAPTRNQQSAPSYPQSQQSQRSTNSKQEYANELMEQLVQKERLKSQANTYQQNMYEPPKSQQQQQQQQELNDQQRAQLQKQKYKEELDRQIQEKRQQSDRCSSRQSNQPTQQQPQQYQYEEQERYTPQTQQKMMDYPSPIPSATDTQESRAGFARRMPFHANQDTDQVERQKQQKLRYAEELRLQMEEQQRLKKEQERKQQEHDRIEQEKFYRALEEEKKQAQRELQKKQQEEELARQRAQQQQKAETFEHQVAYKTAAQRRKEQQINLLSEDYVPPAPQASLPAQATPKLIDDDPKPMSTFERIMQEQDQQPQYNQSPQQFSQQQHFFPQQQQVPQYTQQQPQQVFAQQQSYYAPPYTPPMQLFPNSIQPGMLFQQQQLPQGLFDQINQFQNALFNTAPQMMQPNHLQIHQQYLMQLQQNKHEIEMVRHILEEKLRIQQLEMQNQFLIEQYKTKVRDINSEQMLFEKEISKLKAFLQDRKPKEALNPQVFTSALYMSILGQQAPQLADYQAPQLRQVGTTPLTQHQQQINASVPWSKDQGVDSVQHLLPQHMRTRQEEDVELPGSSDYVPLELENNSIWNGMQAQQNKSFMSDLQHIRGSQDYHGLEDVDEEDEQINSRIEESHFDVDGFDVNMLRTQDYMNMFKQNIQSQPKPKMMTLLRENSNQLERDMSGGEAGEASRLPQSSITDAVSQFQSKVQQINMSDQTSHSQLAVSASIPMSQLQKAQELIMSDAKFVNDLNSIILPEDDIDEEKLNNFIESNEDNVFNEENVQPSNKESVFISQQMKFAEVRAVGTPNVMKVNADPVPLLPKPQTAYTHTPLSNYATGRSDGESVSSKKFKKPKTFDVFSKVDHSQMKLQQLPPEENRSIKVTNLRKSIEIGKVIEQAQKVETPKRIPQHPVKSPGEDQLPLPSNIYSNCTNLNPLTSQTTFIVDKRAEHIMNRLDNFLSQVEQSQDQHKEQSQLFQSKRMIVTPARTDPKPLSRKAREFTEAQREDRNINKLVELRESEEHTPQSSKVQQEYSMMFKYDDNDAHP